MRGITTATFFCPWHAEKTPSLSVNYTKNTHLCMGCGHEGTADEVHERIGSMVDDLVLGRVRDEVPGIEAVLREIAATLERLVDLIEATAEDELEVPLPKH